MTDQQRESLIEVGGHIDWIKTVSESMDGGGIQSVANQLAGIRAQAQRAECVLRSVLYPASDQDQRVPPGLFATSAGSPAEVESEMCEHCEGIGSISYNPNLNPNTFPATALDECKYCCGTGRTTLTTK